MKKLINKFFYRFSGYTPFQEYDPSSFINTPIKCRTTMPIQDITMEQWSNGEWIKTIGTIETKNYETTTKQ